MSDPIFKRRWLIIFVGIVCLLGLAPLHAQDVVPGPQVCLPDAAPMTPASELDFQFEQGEIITARASYQNTIGQVFVITVSSVDQDAINEYLYETETGGAQFCIEVISDQYVPVGGEDLVPDEAITGGTLADLASQGEINDIAFGDLFTDQVFAALSEVGFDISNLSAIFQTLAAAGELPTLADFLTNNGVDADTLYRQLTDTASAEIDTALNEGRLNNRRADELRAEVLESMYPELFYDENLPWLPDIGVNMSGEPEVAIEIALESAGPVEISDSYVVILYVDPIIRSGQTHPYTVLGARWINTTVRVTEGGQVRSRLHSSNTCVTSKYLWSRSVSLGSSVSSGNHFGNRQCVLGLFRPTSYYTLRGTWFVN